MYLILSDRVGYFSFIGLKDTHYMIFISIDFRQYLILYWKKETFYDHKKWSLNSKVAGSLFKQFRKPDIDLFASRVNIKCSKYASFKPDPNAYYVNVFSMSCLNLKSYIFSSFSKIGKVLVKLIQEQVTAYNHVQKI